MKKEFDLKIEGGTLESIKIDSSNSLIIATYKRDVEKFKAGDILVDDLGTASTGDISIFKCVNEKNDSLFDIYALFNAEYNGIINIGKSKDAWDYIEDQRLATEQEKQLLFDALKKEGLKWNAEKLEVEKLDISEIVVDYESAIKYLGIKDTLIDYETAIEHLGIKDTLLVFKNYDRANKFNAQIKLQLIEEAWNKFDGFEADWESSDQRKYYPLFNIKDGNIKLSYTSFTLGFLDFHRSNFIFKTEKRAKQFGEQFIDLFKIAFGF